MSLVLYPDSDSESDQSAQAPSRPVKRKRSESSQEDLPPLPAAFHDLYSTNARVSTSDNPSLHGGRKRATPHVDGNWPSHIYLEWIPTQAESASLHKLIQAVRDAVSLENSLRTKQLPVPSIMPSLQSELGAPLPLHVSLSRTMQIKTDQREGFLDTLGSSLRRAAVHAFNFEFRSLKWVSNFEQNRWFLVLGVEKPARNELNRILVACNKAAEASGHPALYSGGEGDGPMEANAPTGHSKKTQGSQDEQQTDRSEYLHISIAWNLTEPDPEWISLVQNIDIRKHIQSPQTSFDVVKARVGNVVHNFELDANRSGYATTTTGGSVGLR